MASAVTPAVPLASTGVLELPCPCTAPGKSNCSVGRGSRKKRSRRLPLPGGQSRMPSGTSRWRWDWSGVAWQAVRKNTPSGPGGCRRRCAMTASPPRWCTQAKKTAAIDCGPKTAIRNRNLCLCLQPCDTRARPTAVGREAKGRKGSRKRYSLCDASDSAPTAAAAARYGPRRARAALPPVPRALAVCQMPRSVNGRKVPSVTSKPSVAYQCHA
mmetsp:Transcript_80392/g.239487  ORF Transcript_80392/g.239487 Transcript_80392/m.239487 type:complete len:214 (+) Transcript_80392:266-907(+)